MKIQKMFDLSGNVAVVTGGAGYLGQSISEGLAEAGATVYICSRNIEKCKRVASEINEKTGSKIEARFLDIHSKESVEKCFQNIFQDAGKIDILVNNAASFKGDKLEKISEEDWISGIDASINGVFRTTKIVSSMMEKNHHGSIINVSSIYGIVSPDPSIYGDSGFDNPPNYGAGKAAIIQFTRFAAVHLAKKGIRVNSISPGSFPKPSVQENQEFIKNLEKKIPLGRIGNPEELKGAIIFLASKASEYVTGSNIIIDGGWTSW